MAADITVDTQFEEVILRTDNGYPSQIVLIITRSPLVGYPIRLPSNPYNPQPGWEDDENLVVAREIYASGAGFNVPVTLVGGRLDPASPADLERTGSYNPLVAGSYDRWWASEYKNALAGRTYNFDELPGAASARQMTGRVVAEEVIFSADESAPGVLTWDAVSSIVGRHRDVHLDYLVRNDNATHPLTLIDSEGETFLILKPGEWANVRVGVYKDNTGHLLATRAPARKHTATIAAETALSSTHYWQDGTRWNRLLPVPTVESSPDAFTDGAGSPPLGTAEWDSVDTKANFAWCGSAETDRDGVLDFDEVLELKATGVGALPAGYEYILWRMRDDVKEILARDVARQDLAGVGVSRRHQVTYRGEAKDGDVFQTTLRYAQNSTLAPANIKVKMDREAYLVPEIVLSYAAPTPDE